MACQGLLVECAVTLFCPVQNAIKVQTGEAEAVADRLLWLLRNVKGIQKLAVSFRLHLTQDLPGHQPLLFLEEPVKLARRFLRELPGILNVHRGPRLDTQVLDSKVPCRVDYKPGEFFRFPKLAAAYLPDHDAQGLLTQIFTPGAIVDGPGY